MGGLKVATFIDAMASTASAPSLRAIPFERSWPQGIATELLTEGQRQHLAEIAVVRTVRAGALVFEQGAPADTIFIVSRGVLKTFHARRNGAQRVLAFWFPADIVGLAESGRYVNTVQAITAATLYGIDVETLKASFRRDFALHFQFLCKVTHELRQAQHRLISVAQRGALCRVAIFIEMLQGTSALRENGNGEVWFPMARVDVANYLGLTPETLSRAVTRMKRQGLIETSDRHHLRVLDRTRLHALADPG